MKRIRLITLLIFATIINTSGQTPLLSNPKVEKIATGFNFIEGPVWVEDLGLLFSDIPENTVYLFNLDSTVSEYITPSGKSNGLALLNDTLILCQHFDRQIGKYDGENIIPIATHYDGKRLNSPNDLAIKSNGTIFFTDPDFGLNDEGGSSELGYKGIFSLTSDGKVHLLDKTLDLPNGIVFSPDETKLYVINSQVAEIYVWDVVNDSIIDNKTLFYNMSTQWGDGMKTDSLGFLYVTAANGLTIFSAEGDLIETIKVSSSAGSSNCNWGSINAETEMYVTAGNSLYRLKNQNDNTGLNENFQKENPIHLYPNPAKQNENIQIEIKNNVNNNIEIYDASGKLIDTLKAENSNNCLWKAPKTGLYIATIKTYNKSYSKEILVVE